MKKESAIESGKITEEYSLTLKGLLCFTIKDESLIQEVLDSLELYMRRHYSKGGHPAIVLDLDDNKFHFVTLGKE